MSCRRNGTAGIGNLETPNMNVLPENYDAGNTTALAALTGKRPVLSARADVVRLAPENQARLFEIA